MKNKFLRYIENTVYNVHVITCVFSSFTPLALFSFSSSIDFSFFSSLRRVLTFEFSPGSDDDGGGGA